MLTLEQQKLVEGNHNLIYKFLIDKNIDKEEFYDLAAIGLCRAAEVYEESKGAFSTIAYKCMLYAVAHELRKYKALKRGNGEITHSLDVELRNSEGDVCTLKEFTSNGEEFESLSCNCIVINEILSTCTKRERAIFYMYVNGYNQSSIAKHFGISQPHTSRLLNRCINKIKEVI